MKCACQCGVVCEVIKICIYYLIRTQVQVQAENKVGKIDRLNASALGDLGSRR